MTECTAYSRRPVCLIIGNSSASDLERCQEIINSLPNHIINTDSSITCMINVRIKTIIQDGRISSLIQCKNIDVFCCFVLTRLFRQPSDYAAIF